MPLAKGANQGRLLDPKPLDLPGCFDDLCGCGTGHLEILETLGCAITVAKPPARLVSYVWPSLWRWGVPPRGNLHPVVRPA